MNRRELPDGTRRARPVTSPQQSSIAPLEPVLMAVCGKRVVLAGRALAHAEPGEEVLRGPEAPMSYGCRRGRWVTAQLS